MKISNAVLKSLKIGNALFEEIDGVKFLPYRVIWGSLDKTYQRRSVQSTVSRLVSNGLIQKRAFNKNQVYLAITELGDRFYQKQQRPSLDLTKQKDSWDGLYRIVIFDIPERDRVIRDVLRAALRQTKAVAWQKSVWVTKTDITADLQSFVDQNNLADYIAVLEVKKIDNKKILDLIGEG